MARQWRKIYAKMRFEATMLLKTQGSASGTNPIFGFKAKLRQNLTNWRDI
jgi:hypothetical protein